jgi:hypothetical protein
MEENDELMSIAVTQEQQDRTGHKLPDYGVELEPEWERLCDMATD